MISYVKKHQYPFYILIPLITITFILPFFINFTWTNFLIFLFFWFLFGCVGTQIGHHRLFSHNSFKVSKFTKRIIALCSVWGAQGSPLFWSAAHINIHHPKSDTDEDIHSPQHGFFHSFITWYFKTGNIKIKKWPRKLISDKFIMFIHKNYYKLFWIPVISLSILNLELAYFVFILPSFFSLFQENIVNTICHLKMFSNYKNFDCGDNSTNNWFLGIVLWGGGFHNNHHYKPNSLNYGCKWYEFDVSYYVIKIIVVLDKFLFGRGYKNVQHV